MAIVYPNANEMVAHMRGVKSEVRSEVQSRAARVEAKVAAHRKTGELTANVRTGRTDTTVYVEHPAIVAINYGHVHNRNRTVWVRGLHLIEEAL